MAETVTKAQQMAADAKRRWRAGEFATYQDAIKAVADEAEAATDDTTDGPFGDPALAGENGHPTYSAQAQAPDLASQAPDKDQATQEAPVTQPATADTKPAKAPKPTPAPKAVTAASDGATTKQCALCGTTYPATSENFKVATDMPDGLNPQCKNCRSAYHADWRARKALEADPSNADLQAKAATAADAWAARKAMGVGVVPDKAPRAKADNGPAVDATAQQAAELADYERRLAAAGGPGTDEGQAIIAAEAERAKAARVRTPRQATTAKAEAKATPAPKPSQAKRTKAAKAS